MRLACDAPLFLWDEFVQMALYLSTLTVSKALGGQTPYELWFSSHPSLSHLHEIGCHTYVLISGNNPKIAARLLECILISYAPSAKAYRCWERGSRRIVDSHNITFVEHLNAQPRTLHLGVSVDTLANDEECASPQTSSPQNDEAGVQSPSLTSLASATGSSTVEAVGEIMDTASMLQTPSVPSIPVPPTDAPSYNDINSIVAALLIDVEDPDAPKWPEARASADHDKWMEGAKAELDSLRQMEVYQLVPRSDIPANCSILRGKFVCHLKHDENGEPVRYKVRLVAKGFQQVWGRDFSKTTSPTAQLESMCTVLHLAASNDWSLRQYNVKTAFLNGILPDDKIQFMEQPPGFAVPGKENPIWCLIHGLYGMRQSSHIWNKALHALFVGMGFKCFECEWCVYSHRSTDGTFTIIVVHVDDMLVASSSEQEACSFQTELEANWQISALGEPKLIVGIALCRNRAARTIALSQTALIDKIVATYGQGNANSASTPMLHGIPLRRPENNMLEDGEPERLNRIPYRSLVGLLMYVASGTRPDIMFAVSKLSQFLDCYHKDHWQAALRVVQYLKGSRELALHLGGPSTSFSLLGYSDSDYANCHRH